MERDRNITLLNELWQHVNGRGSDKTGLRRKLPSAVPFTLDLESVRLVDEMTRSSWGDLKASQINRALSRLPFEKVWIEYPVEESFDTVTNPDEVTQMGWYCERLDDTHWKTLCVLYMQDDPLGDHVLISPLVFAVNTEGDDFTYRLGSDFQATAKAIADLRTALWTEAQYGEMSEEDSRTMWSAFTLHESEAGLAHFRDQTTAIKRYRRNHLTDNSEFIQFQIKVFPFLLQALATINVIPREEVPYKPSGVFRRNMQIKEFLVNRTVSLTIPSKVRKPGAWARKLLKASEVRMRRHRCRGHWRLYRNADGTVRRRTWIPDHMRGDSSLGFVNQEYQVST